MAVIWRYLQWGANGEIYKISAIHEVESYNVQYFSLKPDGSTHQAGCT